MKRRTSAKELYHVRQSQHGRIKLETKFGTTCKLYQAREIDFKVNKMLQMGKETQVMGI